MQLRTAFDVYVFDVQRYQWLTSQQVADNVAAIPHITSEEKEAYHINHTLRMMSLIAPLVGTIALVVVAIQVVVVGTCRQVQTESGSKSHKLTVRDTCVVIVIGMPGVFIVMCNRATLRMLAIMSGSAWAAYARANPGIQTQSAWIHLKAAEQGLYRMDLELAAGFQYVTVASFAYLCACCLDRKFVESSYRYAMKYAGLQGVYAFVLVGIVRSLGNFMVSIAESLPNEIVSTDQVDNFQTAVLAKVNAMLTFATILCIYNMFVIGKMHEIQESIPYCSIKFLATRALILVAQMQPVVLNMLKSNSPVMTKLKWYFEDNSAIQAWELSDEQAFLWHSSLLSLFCLAISLWNLIAWSVLPSGRYESDNDLGYEPLKGSE